MIHGFGEVVDDGLGKNRALGTWIDDGIGNDTSSNYLSREDAALVSKYLQEHQFCV